ncbi:MAG: thermonuclease family protein [Candidatus Calescibacterium sp.]|nr:thermonuclease family protein [Candidatus Calescibacterium sp.]MDW8132256.1 thermonuclease family protein [Candidatus Calescibacterium sp.]
MRKKINYISRTFNLIILFIILLLSLYLNNNYQNAQQEFKKDANFLKDKEIVIPIKVIDGDTIKVKSYNNNQEFKVRLIGVDTPESNENPKLKRDSKKTGKNSEEIIKMGIKSKEFTENLVSRSKYLYLEYDIQMYDKYNRKLAYVYLENSQMLNYILLKEGYAKVYTVPPNVKYQDKFLEAQRSAQREKKGLWKGSE